MARGLVKYHRYLIPVVAWAVVFASEVKLSKDEIKSAIKSWWAIERIIDEVVIDSVIEQGYNTKVVARLVVFDEARGPMTYEFERDRKGWRISKGPVDESTKRLMIADMSLNQAKKNILMCNMRTLQKTVEVYAAEAGEYPVNLNSRANMMQQSILEMLPSGAKNPFARGEPAFATAVGDTDDWFAEYKGKAVYCPVRISGNAAGGYVIRGSTSNGFIEFVFSSHQ